jgi:baseplate J-like protein
MKTYLIQLEPHDDLVSVRDKMSWAKAPRILLVWSPRRRRLSLNEMDFTLLRRHAGSLGADVALVTSQRSLRRIAEHANIPVYRTTTEAQRAALLAGEPAPVGNVEQGSGQKALADVRRRRKRLERRRQAGAPGEGPAWTARLPTRLGFFALGVTSLLLLLLVFLPSADVRLRPATKLQSLTLPVSASPHVESIGLSGILPARTMTLSLSGSDSATATGSLLVPAAFARGTVTLSNLTNEAVQVPEGTVLLSGTDTPRRFVTSANVQVPAGVGQTANVGVRALQGGAAGNLAAGSTLAFEGPLGLSIAAANAAALTGGADDRQRAPAEDDRSDLYTRLSAALAEQALEQARSSAGLVFPDTLMTSKTLREDYSPAAGQPGTELTLELAQGFQVTYAGRDDLVALAVAALDASLPAGYEAAPGDIILTPVSDPATDSDGATHWEMHASRTIRTALTPGDVIAQIRGRPLVQARAALALLHLMSAPEIRLHPAWLPFVPLIPLRISVDTGS